MPRRITAWCDLALVAGLCGKQTWERWKIFRLDDRSSRGQPGRCGGIVNFRSIGSAPGVIWKPTSFANQWAGFNHKEIIGSTIPAGRLQAGNVQGSHSSLNQGARDDIGVTRGSPLCMLITPISSRQNHPCRGFPCIWRENGGYICGLLNFAGTCPFHGW